MRHTGRSADAGAHDDTYARQITSDVKIYHEMRISADDIARFR